MKLAPLIAFLLLADACRADQFAVFGKDNAFVVGKSSGPADPRGHAFFAAYEADIEAHRPLEKTMDLVNPPGWGKTISAATHGLIQFHEKFTGGFACRLALEGLVPGHRYILTLNGNPERAGNNLLPSPVPGNEAEKYYDFLFITADAAGSYDAGLGIALKQGDYDVRCYVKDASDFKIVLYRDFFPFRVD